jgi:predicted TIM-barrel fold metal-dependent hydrolase
MELDIQNLRLRDYEPRCELALADHTPLAARFPVIDAHNHFWGTPSIDELVCLMDQMNIRVYANLTGNAEIFFTSEGYGLRPQPFTRFKELALDKYPDRFVGFTMAGFARWDDWNLFREGDFVSECIAKLEADVKLGACGLKVLKQLGLSFTDADGRLLRIDDERFDPLWARCAQLGIPVLIHTSDPAAFFRPLNRHNEHFLTLQRYPTWHFAHAPVSKRELLAQRDRMIGQNPKTTFVLPHVANWPENLKYADNLLAELPNVYIDVSARLDELGRQPYTSRDFIIKNQDRILFGTDMPHSPDMYRWYFRILETRDEFFAHPDYDGQFGIPPRFYVYGLHLPDEVLRKVYQGNASRVILRS